MISSLGDPKSSLRESVDRLKGWVNWNGGMVGLSSLSVAGLEGRVLTATGSGPDSGSPSSPTDGGLTPLGATGPTGGDGSIPVGLLAGAG